MQINGFADGHCVLKHPTAGAADHKFWETPFSAAQCDFLGNLRWQYASLAAPRVSVSLEQLSVMAIVYDEAELGSAQG